MNPIVLLSSFGAACFVVAASCLIFVLMRMRKQETPTSGGSGGAPPVTGSSNDMKSGAFSITNYWVASDGDKYLMDCGSSKPKKSESAAMHKKEVTLGSAPGGKKYTLNGKSGSLATVDAYMWDACYCEGTCRVGSSTYNLLSENKQTFMKTDSGYGLGSKGQKLVPFVSVTADRSFPHGSTLLVKNIVGAALPNGKIHNGCVRVDDSCGDGCGSKQLDMHVGTYDLHKRLNGRLQGKSDVTKTACTVLDYGY